MKILKNIVLTTLLLSSLNTLAYDVTGELELSKTANTNEYLLFIKGAAADTLFSNLEQSNGERTVCGGTDIGWGGEAISSEDGNMTCCKADKTLCFVAIEKETGNIQR